MSDSEPSWRSIVEPAPRPRRRLSKRPVPKHGPVARTTPFDSWLYRSFSMSVAVSAHILMAALLMLIGVEINIEEESPIYVRFAPGRGGGDELKASLFQPPGDEGDSKVPEPEPVKPEPKPEPDPTPPAPVAKTTEPGGPAPTPAPKGADPGPGPAAATPGPAVIGAGAASGGTGTGPAVSDKDIENDPTDAIRRRRAGTLAGLRGGSDRAILVVSGCYDRVQEVLSKLDLPHRVIAPEQLPKQDLSQCRALLINCHNLYSAGMMKDVNRAELEREIVALETKVRSLRQRLDATKEKMALYKVQVDLLTATSQLEEDHRRLAASADSALLAKNVGEFVSNGGFLFTSDWGLTILERAVPGYVKVGGVVGPRTVTIRPKPGNEAHPLLEEVFGAAASKGSKRFDWDVDSSSYSIRVDKPDAVDVLVESADLARFPAVAVTFRHEKGRVLHVLSHFQKQATRHGDYALQNMLLNFLVERWEGRAGKAAVTVPAAAPASPGVRVAPAPEAFAAHADEGWGVVLAVPTGWVVRSEGQELVLVPTDGQPCRGVLSLAPADSSLTEGAAGWDEYVKRAKKGFERADPAAATTRRAQAFCSGCPALLATWSVGPNGVVQFVVAAPQSTYVLTWSAPRDEISTWEPLFEKASRAFTILRK